MHANIIDYKRCMSELSCEVYKTPVTENSIDCGDRDSSFLELDLVLIEQNIKRHQVNKDEIRDEIADLQEKIEKLNVKVDELDEKISNQYLEKQVCLQRLFLKKYRQTFVEAIEQWMDDLSDDTLTDDRSVEAHKIYFPVPNSWSSHTLEMFGTMWGSFPRIYRVLPSHLEKCQPSGKVREAYACIGFTGNFYEPIPNIYGADEYLGDD